MKRNQQIARERGTSIALGLAITLAFALRVYRLGDKNIWWDEGLAIWAVRKGFVPLTLWTAGDVHPPLYFWLLKPWVMLAGKGEYRPGDVAHLGLYWRPHEGGLLRVDLVDEKGQLLASRKLTLKDSKGKIYRHQLDFPVSIRTPAGTYHFEVHPLDAPSKKVCLGQLVITFTEPMPKVGAISHPIEVELEDGIVFSGYDLSPKGKVKKGDALEVDLYWKARHKIEQNYTVFVHLLGEAYNPATKGPVWAQSDSQPLDGRYPTSQWIVDTIVKDHHEMSVDTHAPPGRYQIEVGMYLLSTGERLSVLEGEEDRILLEEELQVE